MLTVAHGHSSAAGNGAAYILLWLGGALGVASIPIYYFGYLATARVLNPPSIYLRLITASAVVVASFGALTHGLTALDIHVALATGGEVRTPEQAFADPLSPLVICALISGVGAIVAAACIVINARRSSRREARLAALFNPVVGTVVLTLAANLTEPLHAYLAPSAPNLAHFFFFTVLAHAAGRRGVK